MVFSDIFSTSFLFSIAIIIILTAGIFAYVSYRMGEQDHKLNSMIGLVSTMAEETQFFRSKLNMIQQKILTPDLPTVDKVEYVSHMIGGSEKNELINVSDDEDDDYDDEDEDDDDDDDDSKVSDDSNDSDNSDVSDDEYEGSDNIKMLNLSLANIDNQDDQNMEELSICDIDIIDNDNNLDQEIKTIHLEQPIELEEEDIQLSNDKKIPEDDISFLKNVSINDLGEVEENHASKTEYKKMSLNKLRETAVSKGLISDASKLKKNEILKLLGDE
jgi:hypothetical protein